MSMGGTDVVGVRLDVDGQRAFVDDMDDARRSVKDVGDAADRADKKARNAGRGMGVMKAGIGGVAGVAKAGAAAVGVLGAGAAVAGVKMVGLATDAAETSSKFSTVFAGMEEEVGGFVTQMNADFGITTKELQDAASTFGVFAKAAEVPKDKLAEFSTSLVTAGTDLASFYNAPVDEVFLALRSGLAGEAEPLRKFGIFLSDATMKAEAAAMGLGEELTESQKVMVRQSIIMKSLGDAEGDLARTQDSLANKSKALKGRLTEAGTAIGTAVLPYVTELAAKLDGFLGPAVAELTRTAPMAGDAFRNAFSGEGITTEATNLVGIAQRIGVAALWAKDAFAILKTEGLEGVGSRMDAMLGTGTLVTDTLGALGDIADHVGVIFRDLVAPVLTDLNEIIPRGIRPIELLEQGLGFVADNAKTLKPIVIGLIGAMVAWKVANVAANGVLATQTFLQKANTGAVKASIVQSNLAKAATAIWTGIQWGLNAALSANPLMLVVIGIGLLIAALVLAWNHSETFRNVVTGAFTKVKEVAIDVKDWVVGAWQTVIDKLKDAKDWVSKNASGMWNGIKTAFRGVINFVIDAWNSLDFTLPSADLGPFGKFGGFTLGVPDIQRVHTGGTITEGGSAIIKPGEEMVVLPPSASVAPLSDSERASLERTGSGRAGWPEVIRLELDGKVLTEVTLQNVRDKAARR